MNAGVRALLAALLSLAPALPALAQAELPSAVKLKPGQFHWYEEPGSIGMGNVAIVVSLAEQRAYVLRGQQVIAVSTVSTGSAGRETPPGEFTILQKKPFHRSNLYSNAPMPFMQRLTWDGIAIHAGHLPGYPASHGCIRLPRAFAEALYDLTSLGGTVSVVEDAHGDPTLYAPYQEPLPSIAAETRGLHGPIARPTPAIVAETAMLGGRPTRPKPMLAAEMRDLGGDAFDVVTMRGPPPAKEIVQPLPRGRRGAR